MFSDFAEAITRGDAAQFPVRITQPDATGALQPVDMRDYRSLVFCAKRSLTDPDSQALIHCSEDAGEIEVDPGDPEHNLVWINVPEEQTFPLPNRRLLLWADLRGRDANNRLGTLAQGTLEIRPSVGELDAVARVQARATGRASVSATLTAA